MTDITELRRAIGLGLQSFCSAEPDFSMSATMRQTAADHILGQPAFFALIDKIERSAEHPAGNALRDWFAGQTVSGMLASEVAHGPSYQGATHLIARYAYEMADAMLAERNRVALEADHG